jgi:polysaccharide export outer membrane protein
MTTGTIRSVSRWSATFLSFSLLLAAAAALLPLAAVGAEAPPAASYHLAPADVISVSVYGEPELGGKHVIGERGTVNFPLLGEQVVTGKTVSELAAFLAAQWGGEFLVNPQVTVSVVDFLGKKIYIHGQVAQPGEYYLKTDTTTFLRALSMAGGQTQGAASKAFLIRKKASGEETSVEIDLETLLAKGDEAEEIIVLPGDRISVPLAERLTNRQEQVYISGDVAKPGVYPHKPGLTVLSLAILAGGLTEQAAPARTVITRTTGAEFQNIRVDLGSIMYGESADFLLQPEDKVLVPRMRAAEQFVYLEGQVKKPGAFPYTEGMTAFGLTILGGGFTDMASPSRASLIRKNAEKLEVIRVNFNSIKKGKDPDVTLLPGDILSVPESIL